MHENLDKLYEKLKYRFNDLKLLTQARTHRSKGSKHNERLEFLGDSIVNFVIAEALYHQFPEATEGELSRWRAVLVNRDTLGDLAKELDLGIYLRLGLGEMKSGGGERSSILSCAIEAMIGAIYLDSDFETIKIVILSWFETLLKSLSSAASHKDPKTLLQELVQSKRFPLPEYAVASKEGAAHKQIFTITCTVTNHVTQGTGTSRRRAEQAAAEEMLKVLIK